MEDETKNASVVQPDTPHIQTTANDRESSSMNSVKDAVQDHNSTTTKGPEHPDKEQSQNAQTDNVKQHAVLPKEAREESKDQSMALSESNEENVSASSKSSDLASTVDASQKPSSEIGKTKDNGLPVQTSQSSASFEASSNPPGNSLHQRASFSNDNKINNEVTTSQSTIIDDKQVAKPSEQMDSNKRKSNQVDLGIKTNENAAKFPKLEAEINHGAVSGTPSEAKGPATAEQLLLSRDEMAKREEDGGLLEFRVISNDNQPEHLVQLVTLKNIFSKQLPKMPKEYIVRLVLDRKHKSMVIVKENKKKEIIVVGGICYRPFTSANGKKFAEIAFCAITANEQVKGYGTRLMNHLKEHVKTEGITHFLTYADNYAIGYFKKQGFTKSVSLEKTTWFGYIKDYDGGTLMECSINYHVNYLNIPTMLQNQREFILQKIKERSKSHVVYDGLSNFEDRTSGGAATGTRGRNIFEIPGISEGGWSIANIRSVRSGREEGNLKSTLQHILKTVTNHRSAWPFHEPVDVSVVTDYLDYVKDPIDLQTIRKRLKAGDYYISKELFRADLERMCSNCLLYNSPETNYYKAAIDLQAFIQKKVQWK